MWSLRASYERMLNTFHMRCLRHIIGITCQDKVPNNDVLESDGIPSMFVFLKQRCMRWLGHVVRVDDGRIPKDVLYGELAQGKHSTGTPHLHYKEVCKRDLKALGMSLETWEDTAKDRPVWRQTCTQRPRNPRGNLRPTS